MMGCSLGAHFGHLIQCQTNVCERSSIKFAVTRNTVGNAFGAHVWWFCARALVDLADLSMLMQLAPS